jgi:hypothetical protein
MTNQACNQQGYAIKSHEYIQIRTKTNANVMNASLAIFDDMRFRHAPRIAHELSQDQQSLVTPRTSSCRCSLAAQNFMC